MTTEPTKSGHDAQNIREEQGTHAPGTVPPGDFGEASQKRQDGVEDALTEPEGADD
ncbi:hypothetical protein H9638_14955 [Arthrobacter sp. Sa2BUA2]|uniref:Uncharacterized protein n=1 Tax=Arthrobacter pullicola TaxID=2762224 RepID=A0ABR8YLL6_9MICC|nr:hypothetical protein [Arthrobacter pullicola]MBD8045110.1 hypothetical protein [Arthrobacter pullicola]